MAGVPARWRLGAVASGAAGAGWLTTGLLAALPAGAGLALMAVSDSATHRFSTRTFGIASLLVATALTYDAIARGAWSQLALTLATTAGALAVLSCLWSASSGAAFGDVLLTTFGLVVPSFVSIRSAAVAMLATPIAAALVVLVRVSRDGASRTRTVPFAPALMAGWLVGVTVG